METTELGPVLTALFSELVDGSEEREAYVLNPGDRGLLRSLEGLSAEDASRSPPDRQSSIAAHVDHIRYGLSLMNRWAGGETDAFAKADWSRSWKRTEVTEEEWERLLADLRDEAKAWSEELETPGEVDGTALKGIVASVAHLAYHLGAIRQMDHSLRGPREGGTP